MFGYYYEIDNPAAVHECEAYTARQYPTESRESPHITHGRTGRRHFGIAAEDKAARQGIIACLEGQALRKNGTDNPVSSSDVLDLYQERGHEFLHSLTGKFALAVIDQNRDRMILAIDRMGIETLSYFTSSRGIVFGSLGGQVAGFPGVGRDIRPQAIFEYLFMHMVPAPRTVFQNVSKLAPATAVVWKGGSADVTCYWQPSSTKHSADGYPKLKSSLHHALENAIIQNKPDEKTGAFLSGGLDSSTVAGKLSKVGGGRCKTFSVGFGEADYDELRFARLANSHFGCQGFEYSLDAKDIVAVFSKIATAFDEPFGNSSALPTYYCAKLAADNGVTHLLAGDGGDELFGGNERYARQTIFNYYQKIPAALRSSLVEPLTSRVSEESRITPLRKFRSYVQQARIPLPDRFESWNLVYREGVTNLLHDDFSAQIDLDGPLQIMRDEWDSVAEDSLLNKMLVYDWKFTLADNDLRKVNVMCKLAGIDVSYPMLADDVVDVAMAVPPSIKMRNLRLRSFYKKSMQGFLPDAILTKEKHGFGLPFGTWLKQDRQLGDLIYSNLQALKRRNIVSDKFIDRIVEQHISGHPNYYGYVIWDLAVLEQWLSHNS